MKILVSSTGRFVQTPDGALWSLVPSDHYGIWRRYLEVFDSVRLLARTEQRATPPSGAVPASGDGVDVEPLPFYVGPEAFLRQYLPLRQRLSAAIRTRAAVCLRLPCPIGSLARRQLNGHRPYGVEVIADPFDSYSPGAVNHPLRPVFRALFSRRLRAEARQACAAAYVTKEALQRRYPPAPSAFTTHYSTIELPAASFAAEPRRFGPRESWKLITLASLAQLNKGPDVLLKAVRRCLDGGVKVTLTWLGDGEQLEAMRALARTLGIDGVVHFAGRVMPGPPVFAALDQGDLFVLPSRQEGVPRAMIEAMARGLPCVGSTIGGIPELLPLEDMVPPNEPETLAARLLEVLGDPARLGRMAARNLETARQYESSLLMERRRAFYRALQQRTEEWINEAPASHR